MKHLFLVTVLVGLSGTFMPAFADYYDDSLTPEQIQNLQKNAEKGDPEAEYNLATAYHKGDGIPEDDETATKWYIKSAEQGNIDAQYALGFVYRGGNGVPMDNIRSYMWFDIAANGGLDKAIELRKDVADSMTDDDIEEARNLSREWRKEHKSNVP